jgi:ankyrin repeat domain-containing protein 50
MYINIRFCRQRPQTQSDSVVRESLIVREKLTKLAGSHWNKTPARKLAQNLGQATQELMKLISSWSDKDVNYFDIVIPIEVEKEGGQQTIQYDCKTRLSDGTKVDVDIWEAILGLYVWSLRQSNHGLSEEHRDKFFRAFESGNKNAHQARLLYQKWTNDESALDQNQTSTTFLNGCKNFGHCDFRTENPAAGAALVSVSCDLYTLAAQDIYMHVLNSMLDWLPEIGCKTQIAGKEKKNYKLSNNRVDVLTEGFVKAGLGDQRGSAVCILSVLSNRGLLPEITYKSDEVQQHLNELATLDDLGIYDVSEWLCSMADYEEVEHVLVEYVYLCLRNIMSREGTEKPPALERIVAILNMNDSIHLPNAISKNLVNISSIPEPGWRERFRNEIYWIASRMLQFHRSEQATLYLQELEKQYATQCSMEETYTDQDAAVSSQSALLDMWLGLSFGAQLSEDNIQMILDWLVKNKHYNILEWLIMRMMSDTFSSDFQDYLTMIIICSAAKKYNKPVEILLRHIDRFDIRSSIITELASLGDVRTLEFLLGRDFSVDSSREHEIALLAATEKNQYPLIKFLLEGGVNVDAQNIDGETALMIATRGGPVEIISLLLLHNASLEKRDADRKTALIQAAARGNLNVVELLINKGADINATDYRGRTVLMAATLSRNLPLVKYLCDQKADVQVFSDDQMSAFDIAAQGDSFKGPWTEGCVYLESVGAKRNHGRKYRGY